jgi:2,3-bisphosphoglycerate-independent phosphoglycerate mutase
MSQILNSVAPETLRFTTKFIFAVFFAPIENKMKNTCLIVIDGWGVSSSPPAKGDAIHAAKTPVMDRLSQNSTELSAHGLGVGLPDGLMGNSEVGHLNIGAGRVVYQDIVRIDLSVSNHKLHEVC